MVKRLAALVVGLLAVSITALLAFYSSSDSLAQPADPDDGRVLVSGQTLSGNLGPRGQDNEDFYYFDGQEGQRATISFRQTTTPLLGVSFEARKPDGSLLVNWLGANPEVTVPDIRLSQTGRYRINIIHSGESQVAIGYTISLTLAGGSAPSPTATPAPTPTPSPGTLEIERQLADCLTATTAVFGFDNRTKQARYYFREAPADRQTLTRLEDNEGYWIVVSRDCTLSYGANSHNLYYFTVGGGVNLIGWSGAPVGAQPSPERPLDVELGPCFDAAAGLIFTFDNDDKTWLFFEPRASLLAGFILAPGVAYWIEVKTDCVISFYDNLIFLYKGWNLFGWQ